MTKIKGKAHKFLSTATAHGIPRILNTDSLFVRLFWTILLTGSISFGSYNIYNSILAYYDYPVITNVARTTTDELIFPTITVCMANDYTQNRYDKDSLLTSSKRVYDENFQFYVSFKKSRFKSIQLNNSQLEFIKIASYHGDCVRFNSDGLETANSTDDVFYLVIRNEHTSKKEEGVIYTASMHQFDVYLSDSHLKSFLNYRPAKVTGFRHHLISIEKTEIESKLGEPYNQCSDSVNVSYRQANCVEACINQEIEASYNCSVQSYYTHRELDACYSRIKSLQEYNTYPHALITEFGGYCTAECSRECQTIKFGLQVVNSVEESVNQTQLSFYVNDFSTLEIKQSAKITSFDLISSIGGLLGVFVGVSFLSFMEIFEFIIDVFFVLFIERK